MSAARSPRRVRAWVRDAERPFVLGHRGARRRAPENTLRAFDLALEEGADGVELDVRLDRDGDVVVIHDADLARVTKGQDTRAIEKLGRAELDRVDLGDGATVPRLADVLAWSRRTGARVNVELKRDVTRRAAFAWKVARLVGAEPRAAERFILSSFDPLLLGGVARLLPWVPAGLLLEAQTPVPSVCVARALIFATALHPTWSTVTEDVVRPWKRAGLPVNVWTVNDPAEAGRLDALGVDTLISDVPGSILASLRKS
jgi:glycerophosphoryl diester phosphodiesterase